MNIQFKSKIFKISFIISVLLSGLQDVNAACTIRTTDGNEAKHLGDGIGVILSSAIQCPKNVFEFRDRMKANHLSIQTTMVANRGYHNPSEGSFSFFEMVTGSFDSLIIQPGDFFFGHFTTINENDELAADQGPTDESRLMIEAFAWDANKELYNFYELIGDGKNNQWYFRGDSADIVADNTLLHRQPDPAHPQFGNRLRCSACHGAGGPIMKEIHAPNNDWWEPNRKLDFGGRRFDKSIVEIVDNLVPPDRLATNVVLGIKKIEDSSYLNNAKTISLQEKLRPIFCPVEINFKSDMRPNDEKNAFINIPSQFFINEKLSGNLNKSIVITRHAYENALMATGSHFPETSLPDADHAWLTPVKATSDQLAIDHLIKIGLIDEKFAYDVLSVDMTNPVFSDARCGLLKQVPYTWSSDWKDIFIHNLKSSNNKAATKLVSEMTNLSHTPDYHREIGRKYLESCADKLKSDLNVKNMFLLLAQRREEIKASEISKNRRGQILEPGFRVIFPETTVKSIPGKLNLTESCEVNG